MALLYISEFQRIGQQQGSVVPVALQPSITDQTPVNFGSGAAASSAFNASTKYVMLSADAVCSILFSTAGTNATTSNMRLPANVPIFFEIPPNQGYKVSAVSNS